MFRRLCSRAPRTTSRSVTADIVCVAALTFGTPLNPDGIRGAPASVRSGTRVWGMTAATSRATTQLETLRGLVTEATQRLLGRHHLGQRRGLAGTQPAARLDPWPRRHPHRPAGRWHGPADRVGA